MNKTKKSIINQQYEDYWKFTLEYTDYKSDPFNNTLSLIISFIDKYDGKIHTKEYKLLQESLNQITPKKDMASIRKAINQFLKLGFINNNMKSYHKKTRDFLSEKDPSRKKRIYSEIVYDNASFSRSFTNPANTNELNFLIKTLEFCGSLSKENLLALMFQDITQYKNGYVTLDELDYITKKTLENKTDKRKYNQVNYLYSLCKNILTGVYLNKYGYLTLDKDEQIQEFITKKGRDPYKQRLYKYDLYQESIDINGKIVCYLEDISYPVLIASHIKPYYQCNENEQFDVQNGLLLSKNIDQLFDHGWISFENNGKIMYSDNLDVKLKLQLENQTLHSKYLQSEKRLSYLKYHRENIFNIHKEYKPIFNLIKQI